MSIYEFCGYIALAFILQFTFDKLIVVFGKIGNKIIGKNNEQN